VDITTIGPDEIRSLISMDDAIVAVREGFLALHRGQFEMPPARLYEKASSWSCRPTIAPPGRQCSRP
jgi:ornithine cyclodeaminase/alanine dehydrogenase-like protein (mu-crystallin family)